MVRERPFFCRHRRGQLAAGGDAGHSSFSGAARAVSQAAWYRGQVEEVEGRREGLAWAGEGGGGRVLSALTATCANSARGESGDSDPHKINCCPSILTSRTSCTSPTRRKIKGKSTRAFSPSSVPPANSYSPAAVPVAAETGLPALVPTPIPPHWPFLTAPARRHLLVGRQNTNADLTNTTTSPPTKPWTLPACGTGFRPHSTRTPSSDSKPSSTSSMCVVALRLETHAQPNTDRVLTDQTTG